MTTHKKEILCLAKSLFVATEWPYIESCLDTCEPSHSKTIFVNNELAAFVIVNESDTRNAFISYCGVASSHQGKGYGSKLLKETLAGIFQVDYPATRLYVDTWNVDALRLYTRFGFKIIGNDVVAGSSCHLLEMTCEEWKKSQVYISR